jgi:hypothetical protein
LKLWLLAYLIVAFSLVLSLFVSPDILYSLIWDIFIISSVGAATGLSIAAVVCGSIDLKRIKAGRYSNKGRGFDIAGIVLGGIWILVGLINLVGLVITSWSSIITYISNMIL